MNSPLIDNDGDLQLILLLVARRLRVGQVRRIDVTLGIFSNFNDRKSIAVIQFERR